MGDVVRLAEYTKPAQEPPLLYHCQRCGSREFTLHASGVAYCVDCGALMGNLLIVKAP
jgi:ribosomal protein L37AE/L43A